MPRPIEKKSQSKIQDSEDGKGIMQMYNCQTMEKILEYSIKAHIPDKTDSEKKK